MKKNRLISLILYVLGAILFMNFFTLGSFNPLELGFYLSILFSIVIGLSIDVFIPKMIGYISKNKKISNISNIQIEENVILKEQGNNFVNFEYVGGELILLKNKMMFIPHKFNIQKKIKEFSLNDIRSIDISDESNLIIKFSDFKEIFTLKNPTIWKEKLDKK